MPAAPSNITLEQFAAHCNALYVDPNASCECEMHIPLSDAHMQPFEESEVAEELVQHF